MKTTFRGWFTPAQVQAVKTTELRSPKGHVWLAFHPFTGSNLNDAYTGPPKKLSDTLIRETREYFGLKRDHDHVQEGRKKWYADHKEERKKSQKTWYESREYSDHRFASIDFHDAHH